ncbi:MAG: hypothetical protein REI11_12650 [Patulibacter sp.]|nr:hypothetical protein [Patulibacter sp.]
MSASQIAAQDRPSVLQQRREAQAMKRRPLLDHLPLTVGGVTIEIGGLARDDKTVLIDAVLGDRSVADARAIYEDALAAFNDRGRRYRLRFVQ